MSASVMIRLESLMSDMRGSGGSIHCTVSSSASAAIRETGSSMTRPLMLSSSSRTTAPWVIVRIDAVRRSTSP